MERCGVLEEFHLTADDDDRASVKCVCNPVFESLGGRSGMQDLPFETNATLASQFPRSMQMLSFLEGKQFFILLSPLPRLRAMVLPVYVLSSFYDAAASVFMRWACWSMVPQAFCILICVEEWQAAVPCLDMLHIFLGK